MTFVLVRIGFYLHYVVFKCRNRSFAVQLLKRINLVLKVGTSCFHLKQTPYRRHESLFIRPFKDRGLTSRLICLQLARSQRSVPQQANPV